MSVLVLAFATGAAAQVEEPGEPGIEPLATGGFGFSESVFVPVEPDLAYDFMTGDISGWWDHSFSDKPLREPLIYS